MKLFRQYEEGDILVTEYTKDGETVSCTIKTPIPSELIMEESYPTFEEMQMQTLLNTEYLVIMSELNSL